MKHFTQVMNENVVQEYGDNRITSRLELQDGTVLSIQASGFHYCDPQETTEVPNYAWYESFEIGFPSKVIEEIIQFAEDEEDPCGTVYGRVPKHIIEGIILKRGGIKGVVSFK